MADALQGVLPEFLVGRIESLKYGLDHGILLILLLVVFAYLSSAIFGFALRRLVFLCDTNVRNGRFVDPSIGFPEGKRFTSKELSNALSTPVSVS